MMLLLCEQQMMEDSQGLGLDRLDLALWESEDLEVEGLEMAGIEMADLERVDLQGEVVDVMAEEVQVWDFEDLDGFELVELLPEEDGALRRLAFEDFAMDSFGLVPEATGLSGVWGWGELRVHPLAVDAAIAAFDWVDGLEEAERSLLMIALVEAAWALCLNTARAWDCRADGVAVARVLKAGLTEVAKVQRWLEFGVANGYGESDLACELYRRYQGIGLMLAEMAESVDAEGDALDGMAA